MGACLSSPSASGASGSLRKYSLNDIRLATQDFNESNVIARQANCVVYRGTLNDQGVAVKKLNNIAAEHFASEIRNLRRLSHPGILDFLGFCDDRKRKERILVFEHLQEGSLSKKLRNNSSTGSVLTWQQRLKIAKDVAAGLCYLHEKGIIHGDIASWNIFLGENLEAKICDFGMPKRARDINENTNRNWDVFFFGVLLLELLSGKRPRPGGIQGFDVLIERQDSQEYRAICDPHIVSEIDDDSLAKFAVLALGCKRNNGNLTMSQVSDSLNEVF